MRISEIVDASFKLIVDSVSAPSWTRRDARKRIRNVSQALANAPASGAREAARHAEAVPTVNPVQQHF
jgi:hypothetical protein